MKHLAFIAASYVLTVGGLLGMVAHSWWRMARAERAKDRL
jgi:uncharacterized protein YjeT (DUF2065 family)